MKTMLALFASLFMVCSYAESPEKGLDNNEEELTCQTKAEVWCSKKGHKCKVDPKDFCKQHNNVLPAE